VHADEQRRPYIVAARRRWRNGGAKHLPAPNLDRGQASENPQAAQVEAKVDPCFAISKGD
jgi:hypothetical protein